MSPPYPRLAPTYVRLDYSEILKFNLLLFIPLEDWYDSYRLIGMNWHLACGINRYNSKGLPACSAESSVIVFVI